MSNFITYLFKFLHKGEYFILYFIIQLYFIKYFSFIFYVGFVLGIVNCVILEFVLVWKIMMFKINQSSNKSKSKIEFSIKKYFLIHFY